MQGHAAGAAVRSSHLPVALLALIVATCCALAGCGSGVQLPGTVPTTAPSVDPFYLPPDPLPLGPAGQLIRSEPLPAADGVHAWRILYHSRSVSGTDIAVSGTVFVPATPAPAERRPVVAWAHGTVGLGDRCAPSSVRDPLGDIPTAGTLLAAGYAIVATDFEGIGTPGPHPYLVGTSEGRSVLDSVLAASGVPDAGVGSDVVLYGHSQGGHAVLFAGKMARAYAPKLHVLGVVAAAPPTDLPAVAAQITNLDDGSAYLLMLAGGYSAVDPSALLPTILTPQGVKASVLLEDACAGELIKSLSHVPAEQVFTQDPRTTQPWSAGLVEDSTGPLPRSVPSLVVQGAKDQIVPQAVTAAAVARMCAAGDVITYTVYPDADHDVVQPAAQETSTWIQQRFAGAPASSTC